MTTVLFDGKGVTNITEMGRKRPYTEIGARIGTEFAEIAERRRSAAGRILACYVEIYPIGSADSACSPATSRAGKLRNSGLWIRYRCARTNHG